MLTKSKIAALAALASLGLVMAAPAEAKVNVGVGVGIGIGIGGFYPGYYDGYYGGYSAPMYYGVSCGEARSIVKGNGFSKVKAIDCSAPGYRFIAWQGGNKYKVRVNSRGNITGVTPL